MSFRVNAHKKIKSPLTLSEAKKKLMDYVARRDHSEKELRTKLSNKCTADIIDQTLAWAKEQNWLSSSEKLQKQFSEQLSRRGKGVRKINQKLKELGLDAIKPVRDIEIEKARSLATAKWSYKDFENLDFKESQKLKAKIMRFLSARGYESDIISHILKTEFKKSSDNGEVYYDEEL